MPRLFVEASTASLHLEGKQRCWTPRETSKLLRTALPQEDALSPSLLDSPGRSVNEMLDHSFGCRSFSTLCIVWFLLLSLSVFAAPIEPANSALFRRGNCCGRPSGSPPGSPPRSPGSPHGVHPGALNSPSADAHYYYVDRFHPTAAQQKLHTQPYSDADMGGWRDIFARVGPATKPYNKQIVDNEHGKRRILYSPATSSNTQPGSGQSPGGSRHGGHTSPGSSVAGPSGTAGTGGGSHAHGGGVSGSPSPGSSHSSSPVRDPRKGKGPASSSRH